MRLWCTFLIAMWSGEFHQYVRIRIKRKIVSSRERKYMNVHVELMYEK